MHASSQQRAKKGFAQGTNTFQDFLQYRLICAKNIGIPEFPSWNARTDFLHPQNKEGSRLGVSVRAWYRGGWIECTALTKNSKAGAGLRGWGVQMNILVFQRVSKSSSLARSVIYFFVKL